MDIEIKRRYEFCRQLIQNVVKTALSFYLNQYSLETQYKQGEKLDLVSIANRTVENEIKTALKEYFPNDNFLDEESSVTDLDRGFCWFVDPIDGTNSFLLKNLS
ncbi:inositol monophosphatase family protein [Seminibacterium arietis]|uniref:Inositol monophosphatase family protein n=1 Tax=Seminibacterium arietis TaxID=1173502 RepID=A0ABW3I9M1_9PAST